MGNSFRLQPGPAIYPELKTPFKNDILQIGLLFAFGIIAFSFILIIPGIRGWERLWASIRVFVALWIGAVLLVCNYGSWYSGSVCSRTQYKAHTAINTPQIIQASIGLSISLRGINITLVETDCFDSSYESPFSGEEIMYNERFRWSNPWGQGRRDFGEFGGRFNQEYRAAKYRGMPLPITQIAEHFTIDGEQYLWYRKFRLAGWYTHIWMWTGFATYLLSILLFIHNIRHGAYYMLITGLMLLLAVFTYGIVIRNDPPLQIHFQDGILIPDFNYSFWLTLWTGVLTCIFAVMVIIAHHFYPRRTAHFFHHSIIEDDAIFEGIIEEDEDIEEFGIVSKGSKISFGRGAEGKIRRKGTLNHFRDSIKSTRSDVLTRTDVLPRDKSSTSLSVPATPTSPNVIEEKKRKESDIEMEEITVHFQTENA